MTANESSASSAARSGLSSLMDADLDPGAVADIIGRWRHDAALRSTWHAYQLIGDVLRSDDLAHLPAHDESFMRGLRGRLAQEPIPLSAARPLPASAAQATQVAGRATAAPRRWPAWLMAPAAVAAGFVAVAGVLVLTRVVSINPADGAQLALAAPTAPAAATALTPGELVRNAGLDRYLEAHRALANGVVAVGGAEHRMQIVFEPK